MTEDSDVDPVEELAGYFEGAELIRCSLTPDEQRELRRRYAEHLDIELDDE